MYSIRNACFQTNVSLKQTGIRTNVSIRIKSTRCVFVWCRKAWVLRRSVCSLNTCTHERFLCENRECSFFALIQSMKFAYRNKKKRNTEISCLAHYFFSLCFIAYSQFPQSHQQLRLDKLLKNATQFIFFLFCKKKTT